VTTSSIRRMPDTPTETPAAPGRHLGRSIVAFLSAAVLLVLTVGLPRVYDARYNPETNGSIDDSTRQAFAPNPSWHPVPTPAQDKIYVDRTQKSPADPDQQVEGRDGWHFLGDTYLHNFAQAMGRRYYAPVEVRRIVDQVSAQRAWLRNRSITGEFIIVPAKWSIYPDKLPAWTDGQVMPHIFDQVRGAAPDLFLDLRTDLGGQRQTADTYSRLNSHWTDYGALVAFRALVRRLAEDQPNLANLKVPVVTGVNTLDVNNEFAGINGAPGPNNWTVPVLREPLTPYTVVTPDGSRNEVAGGHYVDPTQMPVRTENPAAGNTLRALVLADSATALMSPYLAGAFGSTMMVRHVADEPVDAPNVPKLVESYRPDVVITLMSERDLDVPTVDSEVWTAAREFDTGSPASASTWPAGPTGVTLSGSNLASRVSAQPHGDRSPGQVVRLDVAAAGPGTLVVEGNADGGPFTRTLRVASGTNALYAALPPHLTAAGIRLHRTAGTGSLSLEAIAFRTLP